MELKDYKDLFESRDMKDVFELNKDFILDLIDTKKHIDKLNDLPLVIVHPTDKTKQRISEAAKVITKLKQVYANQIVVLNKIMGNETSGEQSGDPIEAFKKRKRIDNE
jgi:hypothetical protein